MNQIAKIEPINPGYYSSTELSNEAYHADKAIGSSGIKKFSECPALYHYEYLSDEEKPDTSTKYSSLGSNAHIALLEPEIFEQDYLISAEFATLNKGKKNEKQAPINKTHADWKSFVIDAEEQGKKPIIYSEYQKALKMADAINNHALAGAMLKGGKNEMSFFARDPETGLMLKSRPDKLNTVEGIGTVLIDYKTTSISMDVKKQSDHAFGLGRHLQAVHHKTVTEIATDSTINEVFYITQMQEAPFLVRVLRMPEEAMQIGSEQRRFFLDEMAKCHSTNNWPSYPETIEDLIIPNWFHYQHNENF